MQILELVNSLTIPINRTTINTTFLERLNHLTHLETNLYFHLILISIYWRIGHLKHIVDPRVF
jgi:hypothetical protein